MTETVTDDFLITHSHETTRYYSLPGTAHYEYRTDDGNGASGWQDAGHVSEACLAQIKEGLKDTPWYEIRTVVSVADYSGTYAGLLILAERIEGGTDL